MKKQIPSDFIQRLIASADITEVIGRVLPLKKRGNSHIACCPFHNEKTPSFHVSADKQIYHCFGCGAGGDVITFLREHDHLGFIEAVEELATIEGVEIPYEQPDSAEEHQQGTDTDPQQLYQVLDDAARFYSWALKNHPQHQGAVNYLKGRQLSGATARAYRLGFAPENWHSVEQALGRRYDQQLLITAGLLNEKNGRTYDRFRNRIIFPIRNRRGQVIGFGGRVFNQQQQQPKYLNSPETPVFYKNQELYGLYEVKQRYRAPEELLVVEGYMDVISLAEHGYDKAVATLGTALTRQHIRRLLRETRQIIFCFDGDEAGQHAAFTTARLIFPELDENRTIKFLSIEAGDDPDELIRRAGLTEFHRQLAQARGITDYLVATLAQSYELQTADGQAKALSQLTKILPAPQENVFANATLNRFAEVAGMSFSQIASLFGSPQEANTSRSSTTQPSSRHRSERPGTTTARIMHYLVRDPSLAANIDISFLEPFQAESATMLCETVRIARQTPHTAVLLNKLGEDYPQHKQWFYQLACTEIELSRQALATELDASIQALHKQIMQKRLSALVEKSKSYTLSSPERAELVKLLHNQGS